MHNAIERICDTCCEEGDKYDIPVQCIDGSCPIALSDEFEERGMDVIHSCDECIYNE